MESGKSPLKLFLMIAFVVFVVSGCSTVMGKSRLITGVVQTVKTDEDDYPVEVSIWDGHTEFKIDKNKKQKQLIDAIDKKVAARGAVYNDWDGRPHIDVESFEVLDQK